MLSIDPPLANAFVIFEDIETGKLYVGKTDSQGKISLTIPKGTYWIYIVKEGFQIFKTKVLVTSNIVLTYTLTPLPRLWVLAIEKTITSIGVVTKEAIIQEPSITTEFSVTKE